MTDLLSLLSTDGIATNLSVRSLVEWFIADGKARNLSDATLQFYKQRLAFLIEGAGDRPVTELTVAHLRLLLQHFRETCGWSVGTANHFITSVKVFFNFLETEELITINPTRKLEKLKGPQRLPEPFSPDEIRRLLDACGSDFGGQRNKAMLLVLLDTGMRLAELMGLEVGDVDMAGGQLRVRCAKGRRERMLPFTAPVRRWLLKYQTTRQATKPYHDMLWVTVTGDPLTAPGFDSTFARLAKLAGIEGAHIHRMRHTFAHAYLTAGGSMAMLQRLLGHKSSAMTARYAHIADLDVVDDHRRASPAGNILGHRWRG